MSRPQCQSVCHQFTLSLRHVWNHHLISSVACKNLRHLHSTKSPPSSDVTPSRRHLARCCPSAKNISCTTLPAIGAFASPSLVNALLSSTSVSSDVDANVLLPLGHTIAEVREFPLNVNSPVSLLPGFQRACLSTHELEALSCSILAFGIGFVIRSAPFTLVSTFFVANRRYLEAEAARCRFSLQDFPGPSPRFGSPAPPPQHTVHSRRTTAPLPADSWSIL